MFMDCVLKQCIFPLCRLLKIVFYLICVLWDFHLMYLIFTFLNWAELLSGVAFSSWYPSLLYRFTIEFCVFIFNPMTLLNSIVLGTDFLSFLGVFYIVNHIIVFFSLPS